MSESLIRGSIIITVLAGAFSDAAFAEEHPIHFDLAPIAVARIDAPTPISPAGNHATDDQPAEDQPADGEVTLVPVSLRSGTAVPVTFELKLSSMVAAPKTPRIDQWLVRCVPRDRSLLVADYAPKTETFSDYVGPVDVKRMEEKSDAFGLSIDGSYAHAARGKAGVDHGRSSSESLEFQRHAPVQLVSAAGTVDRGRGVYFKLRWTHDQILEGQKTFRITLPAPSDWRGGLVDVSVIAQAERKSLGGFEREPATLGESHFVVAIYPEGDAEAKRLARALARSEDQLRRLARSANRKRSVRSLSGLMHVVAMTFDSDAAPASTAWVDRVVHGAADPHNDQDLRKLPMQLRIAAIEYCKRRDEFESLGQRSTVSY